MRRCSLLAVLGLLHFACDAAPPQGAAPGVAAPRVVEAKADAAGPEGEAAKPVQDGAALALPDSLLAVGVPAIPRTIVETVGAYSEARSAGLFAWHPQARTMLISTRFADTAQVHELRGAGQARRQLTFFADKVGEASYPQGGDGSYFVFSRDVGGDEFAQLWRFDRGAAKSTLLTDGKSKNELGPWSNAGERFAYTSTRRNGKDTDVYVADPNEPGAHTMVAQVEGGGWAPLDWSPGDDRLLLGNYISVNESELWEVDLATQARKRLTAETERPVAWIDGAYTADGRAVVTTSDGDGEFKQLVRLNLADGAVTPLTQPLAWDVADFAVSKDRKQIAAVANEGGVSRLHLYDLTSGRERPIKAEIPAGVLYGLAWHADGRHLAFSMSSARSPSDVYVLDTVKGQLERWTESEVGGLDPGGFSEPALVRWKSFDEREIPGFYYRPPARFTGKRPVVIIIHGGPEGQSRTGFIGRNNYYLNELGVALIYPNVRGSTGYGKSYVALDNGERREDSVKDIGALLDWVAAQPELDAQRVMIMGGSYGGYMTLASAVHYADRIRCAIDIVGISNFVTFLENTEAYRQDLRRVEYGDERDPTMRALLQKISPLSSAERITKPLFVVQGRNDPRVPASEAEQIVATLTKTGTPVWYLEGKDEGHGFAKKRNQDYQMYATIEFMRRYLLDGLK